MAILNLNHPNDLQRSSEVEIVGRILFLTDDPDLIRRQLAGDDLNALQHLNLMPKLRDDISTDEITPSRICLHFDKQLGKFVYTGLNCNGQYPIGVGEVERGNFVISVAGRRRGKGSSREHSPFAEIAAGIKLVIGESFERIYEQNCQNLGLLTSTDFGLLPRLVRGEKIALAEFTKDKDTISRQIIEYGGLFPFNQARLRGSAKEPSVTTKPRPMTLAEKILARHFVVDLPADQVGVVAIAPGDAGFVRADLRYSHEYVTPMAAGFYEQLVGDALLNDPSTICFFRDHLPFLSEVVPREGGGGELLDLADQLKLKQESFAGRHGIRLFGDLADRKGSEGISHNLILQDYALPGEVIVGSDSHTTHAGAIGCLAFGVGATDLFNAWVTKDVRVCAPEQIRVKISRTLRPNTTAKDLMLAMLRTDFVRRGGALGKIIEYTGDAVTHLSIDERATPTNMAAEAGAFAGIIAPDLKTIDFLVARGIPRSEARELCEGNSSDPDAAYAFTLEIDADGLRPMVATPGDPGNGVFIDELAGPVKIDIAYGGSCTASKNEDLDMYARVFREAAARGSRIHRSVQCIIQIGSQATRRYCERQGYLEVFREVGAQLIEPGCGACINAGPGVSTSKQQVVISAQNRNFPGRSGPGQTYLASPYTVAASAIAGYIAEYQPTIR